MAPTAVVQQKATNMTRRLKNNINGEKALYIRGPDPTDIAKNMHYYKKKKTHHKVSGKGK